MSPSITTTETYGYLMSQDTEWTVADRRLRRKVLGLTAAAVLISTAGAVGDTVWVIGVGAWLLIAAVIIDLLRWH